MPRNTCRPSECVANGNGNGNGNGDKANGNQQYDSTTTTTAGEGGGGAAGGSRDVAAAIVKQEFDAAPPVCHRKSERRKIARDIFLVFEEQPTRRRRGRGGARGKCTRAKQKFGHLKVANTPRINKNVLREIKTEPKCSTAATTTTAAAAVTTAITAKEVTAATVAENAVEMPVAKAAAEIVKEPEKPKVKMATVKLETKTASNAIATAAAATVAAMPAIATVTATVAAVTMPELPLATPTATATAAATATTCPAATCPTAAKSPTTPSVNPIFLWVKQDDTRIVEVRCEDYDKRNRIRLTKTTNGWRSMPRTDASSTRIVKFFHSAATPSLMKVKREQLQQQQSVEQEQQQEEEDEQEQQQEQHQQSQQLLHDWTAVEEEHDQLEEEQQQLQAAVIENVVVVPAQQQHEQQEQHSQLEATPTQDVCFDALLDSETNASTKATKTSTINSNTNSSNPTTPTYQSSASPTSLPSPTPMPLELQLCPKTGLFLPQGMAATVALNQEELNSPVQLQQEQEEEQGETGKPLTDHSLDVNTKNLKDLLDDADDLLQNCSSDNGSNGADLLDSLVKDQQNFMGGGETTTTSSSTTATTASNGAGGLSSFCVPDVAAGKELPSILGMDSSDDAPKCLSFNEAGEIEGLNGDLFLGIDSFDKPAPETEAEANPTATLLEKQQEHLQDPSPPLVVVPDETPKDLSYKKREEVCPPSESRSQCAVTSSSDILKSKSPDPEMLQLPAAPSIPAEVETTSETIKHLILEQFLKLNGNPQQQAEPMDLGKATGGAGRGVGDKLHTVVIDDEDEEDADTEPTEPLKKRPKAIKMDKDPDALTQLKMLISNPQWKVPDPILVPKDRLGAVLASPAREIPLLLTTRPELRLPEAFAYPEIIQNPNILVVTMEQLEAILKNDADQAKTTTKTVATPPAPCPASLVQQLPKVVASPSPSPMKPHQTVPSSHKSMPAKSSSSSCSSAATPTAAPPTSSPAADSSMSTELNATTLALLQQMLWLPYFGQLSQEFFKTLKDPLGLQRKFMSNLLPLYQSQFGLQHLDELYKHCMKQKPTEEQPGAVPPPAPAKQSQSSAGFNGFGSSSMELAFMQKLLQQQQQQQQQSLGKESSQAAHHQHHHLEHKRARRDVDATSLHIPDFNKQSLKTTTPATVAAAAAAVSTPATVAAPTTPTTPTEHKPRLTCKSLSNLLEPESNVVPLLNVPFDAVRRASSMNKTSQQQQQESSSGRTLRSSKACVTYNPLELAKQSQLQSQQQQQQQQQQLQRKRGNMLAHEVQQQQQQQQHLAEAAAAAAAGGVGGVPGAGLDANSALWHPLFGSNPKQGYNSPWQWTTVTATGE